MIKYIVIAIAAACFWFYWGKQKAEEARKKVDQEAVHYTQNLQNDVKRAEDAASKANALIKQQEENAKRGLAHSE